MSVIGTIRDAITGLVASVEARTTTPTGNALNVQIGPGDPISNMPVVNNATATSANIIGITMLITKAAI